MHGTFSVPGIQRWMWQGWSRGPVGWGGHGWAAMGRRALCREGHRLSSTQASGFRRTSHWSPCFCPFEILHLASEHKQQLEQWGGVFSWGWGGQRLWRREA